MGHAEVLSFAQGGSDVRNIIRRQMRMSEFIYSICGYGGNVNNTLTMGLLYLNKTLKEY